MSLVFIDIKEFNTIITSKWGRLQKDSGAAYLTLETIHQKVIVILYSCNKSQERIERLTINVSTICPLWKL